MCQDKDRIGFTVIVYQCLGKVVREVLARVLGA